MEDSHREILIELYEKCGGDDWNSKKHWLSTKSLDSWFGLTMNTGKLTGIILGTNSLCGNLPITIYKLTTLSKLVLTYNKLTGPLSESIGCLTALEELDLSYNEFSGSLPESIGQLTALRHLGLACNKFTGPLPQSIANLRNLKELLLRDNKFTGGFQHLVTLTGLSKLDTSLVWNLDVLTIGAVSRCMGGRHLQEVFQKYRAMPVYLFDVFVQLATNSDIIDEEMKSTFTKLIAQPVEEESLELQVKRIGPAIDKHPTLVSLEHEDGRSVLEIAITMKKWGFVKFLLGRGADLKSESASVQEALSRVDIANKFQILQSIFKRSNESSCLTFGNKLTSTLLKSEQYALWYHLMERQQVELIKFGIQQNKDLMHAKDVKGRLLLDLATPAIRKAINSVWLWFGRYRVVSTRPENDSQSLSYIFKAVDELDLDEKGVPRYVTLKLMCSREHFHREISVRTCCFDDNYVLPIIRYFPDSDQDICSHAEPSLTLVGELPTKEEAETCFLIVFPLADRSLQAGLRQETFVKQNWEEIRTCFMQLVKCVDHMHGKGILHGDIKPSNIVRIVKLVAPSWTLKNLESSCKLGLEATGKICSSAFLPPEAIYADSESGLVVVKSESHLESSGLDYELLFAQPSLDIWALGCVLYQMSTGKPLFQGGYEDNLTDKLSEADSLWDLAAWPDVLKNKKLDDVSDPIARNLIAQMLNKDPLKRPSIKRVMQHPFLSGKPTARMVGEKAGFDVFLSYRVKADKDHALKLYDLLTAKGITVWLDKKCLKDGENWEDGFCAGLVSSRIFVCLISKDGLKNFGNLQSDSYCDNVFLEHRFALELLRLGMIETIFPIVVGKEETSSKYVIDWQSIYPVPPDVAVASVEAVLSNHMSKQALGTPLEPNKTVKSVFNEIVSLQGALIEGLYDAALITIIDRIEKLCKHDQICKNESGVRSKTNKLIPIAMKSPVSVTAIDTSDMCKTPRRKVSTGVDDRLASIPVPLNGARSPARGSFCERNDSAFFSSDSRVTELERRNEELEMRNGDLEKRNGELEKELLRVKSSNPEIYRLYERELKLKQLLHRLSYAVSEGESALVQEIASLSSLELQPIPCDDIVETLSPISMSGVKSADNSRPTSFPPRTSLLTSSDSSMSTLRKGIATVKLLHKAVTPVQSPSDVRGATASKLPPVSGSERKTLAGGFGSLLIGKAEKKGKTGSVRASQLESKSVRSVESSRPSSRSMDRREKTAVATEQDSKSHGEIDVQMLQTASSERSPTRSIVSSSHSFDSINQTSRLVNSQAELSYLKRLLHTVEDTRTQLAMINFSSFEGFGVNKHSKKKLFGDVKSVHVRQVTVSISGRPLIFSAIRDSSELENHMLISFDPISRSLLWRGLKYNELCDTKAPHPIVSHVEQLQDNTDATQNAWYSLIVGQSVHMVSDMEQLVLTLALPNADSVEVVFYTQADMEHWLSLVKH